MPGQAKRSSKQSSQYTTKFVNFKLAGQDKAKFETYMSEQADQHPGDITELMSQGFKFSFSENRENGIALASVTCRDEANINYDSCITSRSRDWYEALLMCVFKVKLLGATEVWSDAAGTDDWG